MNIEMISTNDLVPFGENPRTINDRELKRLKKSLDKWGVYKPLLAWENEQGQLEVISGNQRLKVMQMEPPKSVPVVRFTGSRNDARLVALRDNNHAGEWDLESLSDFIDSLGVGFDLDYTGFWFDDLEQLIGSPTFVEMSESEIDPDIDDELVDEGPTPVRIGTLCFEADARTMAMWSELVNTYTQLTSPKAEAIFTNIIDELEHQQHFGMNDAI